MRSFFIAGASSTTSEPLFYGSWNRLLNTLFPVDTMFEVVPQFPAVTAHEAVDFVLLLLVYVRVTPVFVVEVRPPADFPLASKREEADNQLRRLFRDLAPDLKIRVLQGVSAFGTKVAFYTYRQDNHRLEPERIVPDPSLLTDTDLKEWWGYDVLEEEGATKF